MMLLSLPGFAALQIVLARREVKAVQRARLAFVKVKYKMHLVLLGFVEPETS